MPRKTDKDQDGPVEVVLSTEDGFAYYELTPEQATAFEESGDTVQVLLNGKLVRRTKVTSSVAEEVDV